MITTIQDQRQHEGIKICIVHFPNFRFQLTGSLIVTSNCTFIQR